MVKKTIIWIILLVLLSSFASASTFCQKIQTNSLANVTQHTAGISVNDGGIRVADSDASAYGFGWNFTTLGITTANEMNITFQIKIDHDATNSRCSWNLGADWNDGNVGTPAYRVHYFDDGALKDNINNILWAGFPDLVWANITINTSHLTDKSAYYINGTKIIGNVAYTNADQPLWFNVWTNGARSQDCWIRDLYIYNGSFQGGECVLPPQSINLTELYPTNNTAFFSNVPVDINFNTTANASANFNCSFYINSTLNETKSYISGNNRLVSFDKTFTNSLNTYSWKISCTDGNYSTSKTNIFMISPASLDNCSTYSAKVLNLTLGDENNLSILNGTLEVDLIIYGNFGEANYFDTVTGNNLLVCMNNLSLLPPAPRIDVIASYESPTYVKEFWYLDNGTLDGSCQFNSHTSCDVNLYDLPLTDSTTFLFAYLDKDELEVPDAIVHVFRRYIGDGTFYEVERAKQDNNGETHIHLIEEDVVYYFMITKYGEILFISDSYNAKCISEPCQIELTASEDFTPFEDDYITIDGTSYLLTDNKTSRMVYLDFTSNASDTINFTLYSYNNNEPVLINRTFITGVSGNLALQVPLLYGNATFFTSIHKNNIFVKSFWIDFIPSARDYFGDSGAIFGALILTSLGLMAISEGVILIFVVIVGVFLLVALFIIEATWLAISSLLCAGAILVWKAMKSRGGG